MLEISLKTCVNFSVDIDISQVNPKHYVTYEFYFARIVNNHASHTYTKLNIPHLVPTGILYPEGSELFCSKPDHPLNSCSLTSFSIRSDP